MDTAQTLTLLSNLLGPIGAIAVLAMYFNFQDRKNKKSNNGIQGVDRQIQKQVCDHIEANTQILQEICTEMKLHNQSFEQFRQWFGDHCRRMENKG